MKTQSLGVVDFLVLSSKERTAMKHLRIPNECFEVFPDPDLFINACKDCAELESIAFPEAHLHVLNPEQLNTLFEGFARCPKLVSFDFSATWLYGLEDRCLSALTNGILMCKRVTALDFSQILFTDETQIETTLFSKIKDLSTKTILKSIKLSSIQMDKMAETTFQSFITFIEGMNTVTEIDLSNNKIGTLPDARFYALCNAINHFGQLESLSVSSNTLESLSEDKVIALSETLKRIYSLRSLSLADNRLCDMSNPAVERLLNAISKNVRRLNLSQTGLVSLTPEKLRALKSLNSLQALDVSRNELDSLGPNSETFWNTFCAFLSLKTLNLSHNDIPNFNDANLDFLIDWIVNCSSLECLDISNCNLGRMTEDALKNFNRIFNTDSEITQLGLGFNELPPLFFSNCHFENLKNLIILDLSSNIPFGTQDSDWIKTIFGEIGKCTHLQVLNFKLNFPMQDFLFAEFDFLKQIFENMPNLISFYLHPMPNNPEVLENLSATLNKNRAALRETFVLLNTFKTESNAQVLPSLPREISHRILHFAFPIRSKEIEQVFDESEQLLGLMNKRPSDTSIG